MAWNTVLVERLRYVIHDLDPTNYAWTDVQLEKFLAVSAIHVINDLSKWSDVIGGTYIVNTEATGAAMITPDPLANGSNIFGNLIVIKAACVIANSELRKIGKTGGWKITDDKSTIDGTKAVDVAKNIAKDYCSAYESAIKEFKLGNLPAGQAILSPYASPNAYPYSFPLYNGYRWSR
jgi:hypothetical protein